MFLVMCILAVRNIISVLYVVPNMWFGVGWNADDTRKIVSSCPRLVKKPRSDRIESDLSA